MRLLVILLLMSATSLHTASPAFARGRHSSGSSKSHSFDGGSVRVRGYTKKNGTYVAPHRRTRPNSTRGDNWSTKGNINPYTGKEGTKEP
jgi:hypothetical protein